MNASNWSTFLGDPQKISGLYDQEPDLNSCELFYVQVDERGSSITLGFETSHLPQNPTPEQSSAEFNSFEFYLTFMDTQDLSIKGWTGSPRRNVGLERTSAGTLAMSITSTGTSIEFQARSASCTKTRMSLISRGE
ncbi:Imm50 family immunity protein [Streptomyces sp. NPDC088116]|uniref:Imm50 family immunity protein n=1 Tax=Streptomyces sp. NPDC088116 TaxID=3365825 RepID=UPI0038092CB4